MEYRTISPECIVKHGPKTIELEDGTKLRMNKDARLNDVAVSKDLATTSHFVFGFNQNTDVTYLVTRTIDLTSLDIVCITVRRVEII